MLRKFALSLAILASASLPLATSIDAAASIPALGAPKLPPVAEKAQFVPFFYSGNNYCWYPNGWRGPGWYWCGYAYRTGYGWGGGYGWHGGGRWHGGPGGYRGPRGGFHGGPRHGGFHGRGFGDGAPHRHR